MSSRLKWNYIQGQVNIMLPNQYFSRMHIYEELRKKLKFVHTLTQVLQVGTMEQAWYDLKFIYSLRFWWVCTFIFKITKHAYSIEDSVLSKLTPYSFWMKEKDGGSTSFFFFFFFSFKHARWLWKTRLNGEAHFWHE